MKALTKMLGRLDAVEKWDGTPWEEDNWRHGLVGCSGIVTVYESERQRPGQLFVRFEMLADKGEGGELVHAPHKALTTSYGQKIPDGEGGFAFVTSNSVYRFLTLKKKRTKAYLRAWHLSRTQIAVLLETKSDGPSVEESKGPGIETGPGHTFWTHADIARVLGEYEDEVVQATDTVLGHTTIAVGKDGSALVHSSDVAQLRRWFFERRKASKSRANKESPRKASNSDLREYTTRAVPNILLHIRDYTDLAWFVEEALSMSTSPIPLLSQYEADRTLISALVGLVFDCGDLFANPYRLTQNDPDYQFETVAALALFDEEVLSSLFRQIGFGEHYDRDAHRWVDNPHRPAKRNGVAYTQWRAFQARGYTERRSSLARCRKLLSYLADEGIEEFSTKLVRCALDREIYYMGRFA